MERLLIYYALDDDGEPFPIEDAIAWGQWFNRTDRHVALDTIGDVEVSTVFLAIDHAFHGGAPVLWETMVFRAGSLLDEYCERYTSKAAALARHTAIVAHVRALMKAI